jgi:coenzyme F420-0:L-glutamate ligase/coenzyme F420-1:gamma-L-glutamate ligase
MTTVSLTGLTDLPLITAGDNLPKLLASALADRLPPQDGDVLVVAQKVVSKAEGAVVQLADIVPSERALDLAQQTGRDPRHIQVILNEAAEVLEVAGRVIVTRHRLGYVGTNSGVDRSNVAAHEDGHVVLLPKDPDASARAISDAVFDLTGARIAVVINDSGGREHRDGSVGESIGLYGLPPLQIETKKDLFGNKSTVRIATVDELAAAASLLMGQADEAVPAVLVRGLPFEFDEQATISTLLK